MTNQPIRVLIADDSVFMRKLIRDIFESADDFTVAGTVKNGREALDFLQTGQADIITLDLEMPVMDGITFLQQYYSAAHTGKNTARVLILSSLAEKTAPITFKAMELGAVDFIQKPSGSISLDIKSIADNILQKARDIHAERHLTIKSNPAEHSGQSTTKPCQSTTAHTLSAGPGSEAIFSNKAAISRYELLLIGASTGGPQALRNLIPSIDPGFPYPVLIVQHMPEGFTKSFADHLNQISRIPVHEAEDGQELKTGEVYIAPGNKHFLLRKTGSIYCARLDEGPKVSGHKPSVDAMLCSANAINPAKYIAVIMTGMGADGAREITRLAQAGGKTIAQDKDSCVVFGMPRVAVSLGKIHYVEPLGCIYPRILDIITG